MPYLSLLQQLKDLQSKKPMLFSPMATIVKEKDAHQMKQASLDLLDFVNQEKSHSLLLNGKPNIAQYFPGNISAMIGIDFHITNEGPKLIEINTNAGGLLTAALWSYKNNTQHLKQVIKNVQLMFDLEFQKFLSENNRVGELKHVVIIDQDPENEFTLDDFLFTEQVFQHAGYITSISKTEHIVVEAGKAYVQGNGIPIDLIYNRDCDFYMSEERSTSLKNIYIAGLACVTPNPYGYALLSDKGNLEVIYEQLQESESENFTALKSTMLPTKSLKKFLIEKISRKNWFFKPINEYAGRGVFRGKKVSTIKFNDLNVDSYIAQKEAPPGVISYENKDYKYDIRVFVYDGKIIDISSRVYQGRITNFRTELGGYSPVLIEE